MPTPITCERLSQALTLTDLTDPAAGAHCMQQLVADATDALAGLWPAQVRLWRGERVVTSADNYDELGYPADGPARDERYTRYVDDRRLLRTQMSAVIPGALRTLTADMTRPTLLCCPGIVYRRDSIDRLHVAEPHQLDLWLISPEPQGPPALERMIAAVVDALIPGCRWRATAAEHPYTTDGLEVEIQQDGQWVELLECGLASRRVLDRAGLAGMHGLAMGVGLDRAVMLRKGITDIRLLRSTDPRVAAQMLDLRRYQPVSDQPAARRDLSICCPPGLTCEDLGDRVRDTLPADHLPWIEELTVLSRARYDELPEAAHARMGMQPGQENLLLRLELRHPTRSLPKAEANRLRDLIYQALHQGARAELTGGE